VLAVAGPVIFHLIRRTTRERTPFSSLQFLQPDPPKLTERSRVEHWLLLLLRAAALALLALAFARPFFKSTSPSANPDGSAKRSVLLVDISASMRRTGLRQAAFDKAEVFVKKAGPGNSVAVLAFAGTTRTLMDFPQWSALPPETRAAQAMALLKQADLTWESTSLADALGAAADLLRERSDAASGSADSSGPAAASGGEVMLITDLQDGSRLTGLQNRDWPQGTVVTIAAVAPDKPGNAGITLAAEGAAPAGGGTPPARVRVWNAQDSSTERFQLGWAAADGVSFVGQPMEVYAPPGQARVISLDWLGQVPPPSVPVAASTNAAPATPLAQQNADPQPGRILLKGDAELFDNTVHAVPPAPVKVTAFYLGTEALEDTKQPLFFLNRALPQSRLLSMELVPLPPAAAIPPSDPGKPRVFFLTGVPSDSQLEAVKSGLSAGDLAVAVLTSASQGPALAKLAGVESVAVEEAAAENYAMLGAIDFKHPLFAPFADPRFSDFTKIRFWHHRKLDANQLPGSRVVAKFDSGDPAVLDLTVGKGRLVVMTSAWHPADSQLALSSKFVPLVASLLESGGVTRAAPSQFIAGGVISREALDFAPDTALSVTLPGGSTAAWDAGAAAFAGALEPGIYTVSGAGKTLTFAVNSDPAESRTAPLPVEELERLGVPIASPASAAARKPGDASAPADLGAVETESRQKLWRWIIAAALAVLIVETVLAGLTARRPASTSSTGGSLT
jgi:hypothetical protein